MYKKLKLILKIKEIYKKMGLKHNKKTKIYLYIKK